MLPVVCYIYDNNYSNTWDRCKVENRPYLQGKSSYTSPSFDSFNDILRWSVSLNESDLRSDSNIFFVKQPSAIHWYTLTQLRLKYASTNSHGVVVDEVYGYGVRTLKRRFVSSAPILRRAVGGVARTNAGSWTSRQSVDRAGPVTA